MKVFLVQLCTESILQKKNKQKIENFPAVRKKKSPQVKEIFGFAFDKIQRERKRFVIKEEGINGSDQNQKFDVKKFLWHKFISDVTKKSLNYFI